MKLLEYGVTFFLDSKVKILTFFFSLCVRVLRCLDVPKHVAFIADGNRTYSKQRGISRHEAYRKGMEKIFQQIKLSSILGISDLTFFLYSSHNNRRKKEERNDILIIVETFLQLLLSYDFDYRYNILGDGSQLPLNIYSLCNQLVRRSNFKQDKTINLAINYSAKTEMICACERLLNACLPTSQITKLDLDQLICARDIRKPDLIIRTSGQKRLSDFYLWQGVRSMLFFTDQCWPEFSDWTLLKAIFYHQFHQKPINRC